MVTAFTIVKDNKKFRFSCKQTYSKSVGHQATSFMCNGVAITGSDYQRNLNHFKNMRRQ